MLRPLWALSEELWLPLITRARPASELLVRGGIAGLTIFFGLPLGRIERPMPALGTFLNAIAIGVVVFLLFDILEHANETVALIEARDGTVSWGRFVGLAAVFAVGVGLLDTRRGYRHA